MTGARTPVILVDIDGTVALRGDRDPYDWDRVGEDAPNLPVIAAVRALISQGHRPVFMSGRSDVCVTASAWWLNEHVLAGLEVDLVLHMRPHGDGRPDDELKSDLFDRFVAPHHDVLAVFDDRDSVVAMWRERGLTVFQVAYGDF